MREATIKVYSFTELPDEIQQKVIKVFRDYHVEIDNWHEPVTEIFTEKLEKLSYTETKTYFSGFWSQGDGACFEGKVYLLNWLKAHKKLSQFKNLVTYLKEQGDDYLTIKQTGHYYHSRSMAVVDEVHTETQKQSDELSQVIELIEAEIEEVSDEYYKDLENYYNELTSDEAVKEALIDNDYEFRANGELWTGEKV